MLNYFSLWRYFYICSPQNPGTPKVTSIQRFPLWLLSKTLKFRLEGFAAENLAYRERLTRRRVEWQAKLIGWIRAPHVSHWWTWQHRTSLLSSIYFVQIIKRLLKWLFSSIQSSNSNAFCTRICQVLNYCKDQCYANKYEGVVPRKSKS